MNRSRRVWDELLLVIEQALAAFSGVSPDLIVHSLAIPKDVTERMAGSALRCGHRRFAKKITAEKLHKER